MADRMTSTGCICSSTCPEEKTAERQESGAARGLPRACSRQAVGARDAARAGPSVSAIRNEGWCGHGPEGLYLMRISLGGRTGTVGHGGLTAT
jgi:hypothetical protein